MTESEVLGHVLRSLHSGRIWRVAFFSQSAATLCWCLSQGGELAAAAALRNSAALLTTNKKNGNLTAPWMAPNHWRFMCLSTLTDDLL